MRPKIYAVTLASMLTGVFPALAADTATPEEVIAKFRAAAEYLARAGESGLATFDTADSEFVWKDSYVFVYDCPDDVIAAHPVAESRGGTISALRGGDGGTFGIALYAAAEQPGGSWTEYSGGVYDLADRKGRDMIALYQARLGSGVGSAAKVWGSNPRFVRYYECLGGMING